MSGPPEGDASPQMRRVLYEVGALWQRVRKKVDRSGDTMTGDLEIDTSSASPLVLRQDSAGPSVWLNANDDGNFFLTCRDSGDNIGARFDMQRSNALGRFMGTSLFVENDLDVDGTKNARIVDPDNPTHGWRFAAVEADRSGVLEHEAEVDVGTTYALPPHWPRIAKNLRAYIQPLGEGHVWPEIDRENWTITPRGRPSRCLILARADRADTAVDGWQHEVEVPEDEETE